MSTQTLVVLLAGGGAALGVFLAAVHLFRARLGKPEDGFLAGVVFVCGINVLHPHLGLLFPSILDSPQLFFIEPSQFLIMPLVWFYLRKRAEPKATVLRIHDILHALPFLLIVIVAVLPATRRLEQESGIGAVSMASWAGLCIQSLIYALRSGRILHRAADRLNQELSNLSGFDVRWLRSFLHLFVGVTAAYFFIFFAIIHFQAWTTARLLLSLLFTGAVWFLGFQGLNQKPLTAGLRGESLSARATIATPPSRAEGTTIPLSSQAIADIRSGLQVLMAKEMLYTDPDLSLDDIVRRLGYSRNEVSWVLNQELGKNFYRYVNEYRVDRFKLLVGTEESSQKKLLSLALESGFNSKPAFNAVFKKLTGLTPSEYQRSQGK